MCKYFSCIVTDDLKVHWLPENPKDHIAILEKLKIGTNLQEEQIQSRKYVQIEITPKNISKITRNLEDWQLTIDEERTLPEWFIEKRNKAENACLQALKESLKINVAIEDEKVKVDKGFLLASGKASVVASGSVSIEASGSVSIVASGSVSIEAYDSVSIVASDSVSIKAYGSVSIEAYDSVSIKAYDSVSIKAYQNAKFILASKTATAIKNGKIFVHNDAEIVKVKPEKEK
jgi:hypothetical protein